MHPLTTLLLLTPAVQDWSAHPLPSLCNPPAHSQGPMLLGYGAHIAIRRDPDTGPNAPQASLAPSLLTQLISGEFGRTGLTLVPGSQPLLVRAGETEHNRLRAIFSALDDAGERLQIQLQVDLLPSAGDETSPTPPLSGDSSTTPAGKHWTGEVRSGDTISFGVRKERSFIGGYEVEVATDSGVADPHHSSALHGETLHLLCCRVRGGEAVHIEGLLDLATIAGVETFDPDTPDLGMIEQPRVSVCQLAFSGVATPQAPLRILIHGAQPFGDRTLIIAASTQPDHASAAIGWTVRDLAFLDSPGLPLTPPRPGLRPMSHTKAAIPPVHTRTSPASLVGLLTERSSIGNETGRIHSTERLLLIPAASQAALARTDALIAAMEAPLLAQVRCHIRHGETRISIPATHGRNTRVLLGEERPYLIDYHTDIASNSWMPSPVTEVVFDGICIEGRTIAGTLHVRWWLAATTGIHIAGSDLAHLGALQQPDRAFSAGSDRLQRGSFHVLAEGELELSLQ